MADDFTNRDSHLESVEKIRREFGEQKLGKHRGGYLSKDEYATLIYYWAGEEHEGDVVEGVIASLANQPWAHGPIAGLPVAGAVMAFCELYRDREPGWRDAYPYLFSLVRRAVAQPDSDPGWSAYYIAQWFILRRARRDEGIEILDKLWDRIAAGGEMYVSTHQAIQYWAAQCEPFRIAIERAGEARQRRMVIQ